MHDAKTPCETRGCAVSTYQGPPPEYHLRGLLGGIVTEKNWEDGTRWRVGGTSGDASTVAYATNAANTAKTANAASMVEGLRVRRCRDVRARWFFFALNCPHSSVSNFRSLERQVMGGTKGKSGYESKSADCTFMFSTSTEPASWAALANLESNSSLFMVSTPRKLDPLVVRGGEAGEGEWGRGDGGREGGPVAEEAGAGEGGRGEDGRDDGEVGGVLPCGGKAWSMTEREEPMKLLPQGLTKPPTSTECARLSSRMPCNTPIS